MNELVESKYADVRKFLAESLVNAEREAVEAYSFDLLIDDKVLNISDIDKINTIIG